MVNAGNGLIRFIHNQINLPDSSENFAGSIGTIVYRIQANQELMPGQYIGNQASIVFDVNPAIQTNEALVGMPEPTGISQSSDSDNLFFPNPAKDQMFIKGSDVRYVSVYNALGQLVLNESIGVNLHTISLDGFDAGIYNVQLIEAKGKIHHRQLIVQKD
jgi:hypothetical protein